ncbi:MAG: CarD family transcriptional regulator [Coriobacteriales bacterium]
MFAIGDYVIYGRSGVCEVADIVRRENPATGDLCDYYALSPVARQGTIYTPVDNKKVFMRPVISSEKANALIDEIPSIEPHAIRGSSTQQLIENYRSLMSSHDCADLIGLVVSAHAKQEYAEQHNRNFGHIDKRFMQEAEELISAEFSIALGIPKEDVNDYIAKRVEGAQERSAN